MCVFVGWLVEGLLGVVCVCVGWFRDFFFKTLDTHTYRCTHTHTKKQFTHQQTYLAGELLRGLPAVEGVRVVRHEEGQVRFGLLGEAQPHGGGEAWGCVCVCVCERGGVDDGMDGVVCLFVGCGGRGEGGLDDGKGGGKTTVHPLVR